MKKLLLVCFSALLFTGGCLTSGIPKQTASDTTTDSRNYPPATINDLYGVWHTSMQNAKMVGTHKLVLSKDHHGYETMWTAGVDSKGELYDVVQFSQVFTWTFDEKTQELIQTIQSSNRFHNGKLVEVIDEKSRKETAQPQILKLGKTIAGLRLNWSDGERQEFRRSEQKVPETIDEWEKDYMKQINETNTAP